MDTDAELKAAIKQVAQAKVAEALGGDILGDIIKNVMDHKNRGPGRNDKTMFEEIVDRHIVTAIETAVREHMAENISQINAAVKLALHDHADRVTTSILDAFNKDDWRASLNVTVNRRGD